MIDWNILDLTFVPGVIYNCSHIKYSDNFCTPCKQHNYQKTKQHLSEYQSKRHFDMFSDTGYILVIPTEYRLPDVVDICIQCVQEMMTEQGKNSENIRVVTSKFNNNKNTLCVPHYEFDYVLHAYGDRQDTELNTHWNSNGKHVLYMPGKPTPHRLSVLSEFITQNQLDVLKYSLLKPASPLWNEFYVNNYLRLFPDQTESDAIQFMEKYNRTLDVTQLERQSHTHISKYHNTDMDIYHKGAVVVSQQIDISVYQDTYMRLVSETGMGVQTTEKTWTPIMDQMPFFLTNGSYDYVIDRGFQTYNQFVKSGLAEAAILDTALLPELVKQFRGACETQSEQIQKVIDWNFKHFQSYVIKQEKQLIRYLPEELNYKTLKPYILGLYG